VLTFRTSSTTYASFERETMQNQTPRSRSPSVAIFGASTMSVASSNDGGFAAFSWGTVAARVGGFREAVPVKG